MHLSRYMPLCLEMQHRSSFSQTMPIMTILLAKRPYFWVPHIVAVSYRGWFSFTRDVVDEPNEGSKIGSRSFESPSVRSYNYTPSSRVCCLTFIFSLSNTLCDLPQSIVLYLPTSRDISIKHKPFQVHELIQFATPFHAPLSTIFTSTR